MSSETLALIAAQSLHLRLRWHAHDSSCCLKRNYNLTGSTCGICSECGMRIPE